MDQAEVRMTQKISRKTKKPPPELKQLELSVAQFMQYWGFKKIHGRIWTHLFTSQKPLDSITLMSRLKVSKGLMSLAIRDLIEYEVIKSDHVGRHGTTFYAANPDVMSVISNVLKSREAKMLAEARKAGESLKKLNSQKLKSTGLCPDRIQKIIDLTETAQFMLDTILQQSQL
jgi:HTH-type transcriptional regulator, glycine betaine synthesis regulator